MDKIKDFNENGFYIGRSIIPISLHKELFLTFYDLATSMVNRYKIQLDFEFKNIKDVEYPNDINQLDKALFAISDYRRDLIGEIYDTIAYCSAFLKLVSHPEIENNARELLSLESYSTIYSVTHRIRMDEPEDHKRRAGWHQEIFHTYPDTKFIQTWGPVIRNSTVNNGTIEVCQNSHINGVVDQIWEEEKGGGYAHRILVKDEIVQKHKPEQLPMEIGDVMFFDPHLIHRSGYNSSKEIRYSQVGMWSDCSHKGFRTPKPEFISRSDSPKDNYDKHMAIIRKQ
ncbi:MAG: phytanoyl-CoA dioxygenase family protein [Pseudomonadota bacterium]|nr:phytanoyl-CoA dioxygenase family protein [Pseudomonadota bacterium]|tara:strand:+ start:159 stop:1010 length:852 start_codon:yes stop_codon:yes gene_type:complete